MKGYTIQKSIELLEKKAGSGSGGASTAAEVSFDNTGTGLASTNVQTAISEVNTNVGGLSGRFDYSTVEKVVGKWIDGRDIYQKTFDAGEAGIDIAYNAYTTTSFEILDADFIVRCEMISTYGVYDSLICGLSTSHTLNLQTTRNGNTMGARYVTVDYVKTAPVTNTRSKKSKKEE